MKRCNWKLCVWLLTILFALSACASGPDAAISENPETESGAVTYRPPEKVASKTIRLGSSLYAVQIAREFSNLPISNDDWQDDMIGCYHNNNTLLDFAVYQFSKEGYPDALEDFIREEAEEYEATEIVTDKSVNGIPAGYYRSIAEYGGVFRDGLTYVIENSDEYIEIDFWFIGYQAEDEARRIIDSLTLMESEPLPIGAYQAEVPKDFALVSEADANPLIYASGSHSLFLYISRFPAAKTSLTEFVRSEVLRKGGSDLETDAEINGIPVASYRSVEALDGSYHSVITYVLDDGGGFTTLAFRLDGVTAEAEAEAILGTLSKLP